MDRTVSHPKLVCWRSRPWCEGIHRWGPREVLGVSWGHGGGAVRMGGPCLYEEGLIAHALTRLSVWGCTRWPSTRQQEDLGPEPNLAPPHLRLFQPPMGNKCFLCKPPADGILLVAQTGWGASLYLQRGRKKKTNSKLSLPLIVSQIKCYIKQKTDK